MYANSGDSDIVDWFRKNLSGKVKITVSLGILEPAITVLSLEP